MQNDMDELRFFQLCVGREFSEWMDKHINSKIPSKTITYEQLGELRDRILQLEAQVASMTLHINRLEKETGVNEIIEREKEEEKAEREKTPEQKMKEAYEADGISFSSDAWDSYYDKGGAK